MYCTLNTSHQSAFCASLRLKKILSWMYFNLQCSFMHSNLHCLHMLMVFLFSSTGKRPLEQISATGIRSVSWMNVPNFKMVLSHLNGNIHVACPAHKPHKAPCFQVCFHTGCISLVVQRARACFPFSTCLQGIPRRHHKGHSSCRKNWTELECHPEIYHPQCFALMHLVEEDTSMDRLQQCA